MSEPFQSEIRMFGFSFAPRNWATCDGQLMSINQNQTLYALIGSEFGGDGRTTFALPDLRGRVPVHGRGALLGNKSGAENVTLTTNELPTHNHTVKATTSNANTKTFTSNILAAGYDKRTSEQHPVNMYAPATNLVALNEKTVTDNGSGQSHNNMQPSIVVNFCMALLGTFPSRN